MLKFGLRKYVYFLIYSYNTDYDEVLMCMNCICKILIVLVYLFPHVLPFFLRIAYISDTIGQRHKNNTKIHF